MEGGGKTEVAVQVQKVMKGRRKRTATFSVPGGALNDSYSVQVGGQPAFEKDDEVILFLCGEPGGYRLCNGQESVSFGREMDLGELQKQINLILKGR